MDNSEFVWMVWINSKTVGKTLYGIYRDQQKAAAKGREICKDNKISKPSDIISVEPICLN